MFKHKSKKKTWLKKIYNKKKVVKQKFQKKNIKM